MRNLCIFGLEGWIHSFLILSLGDWIVHIHCKPVKQTVWIVTCWNDPLWVSLKNYIDLAQIYSTVKTFRFCTKLILKIYTHTAYFTYSIANLRKRSAVSTHFLSCPAFGLRESNTCAKAVFSVLLFVQNEAARPRHENKPHTKHIFVPLTVQVSGDVSTSVLEIRAGFNESLKFVFAHTLRLIPEGCYGTGIHNKRILFIRFWGSLSL